jgi:hypothetical protein
MSENITHTAVTDDCARLALHSPAICAPFKLCLNRHLEIARLGGITRSGGKFVTALLGRYREAWPNRRAGDLLEDKLAFVLGWLCHRAADLQMKPIFHAVDGSCELDPTDCSVYHDVFLFRQIYGSGQHEPYSPSTLEADMASSVAPQAFAVGEIESVLRAFWQRALLGLHTFIPDQADIEGWLERLFRARQQFYVDIARYAQAYSDPDPDMVRRFIVEVNFYDPCDPLIRLARSLQWGAADEGVDLQEAVEAAGSQSQYAQALRRGYLYLQAASDYFVGQIVQETLKDRLERGKQGVG